MVTLEDLHAGATVVDGSSSVDDCGVSTDDVARFCVDVAELVAGATPLGCLLWGISIGVLAEQHRVHRTEHVGGVS
jgi:hypothetical protein